MPRLKILIVSLVILLSSFSLIYKDTFITRYSPTRIGTHRSSGTVFFDRWRTDNEYIMINEHFHVNQCRLLDRQGRKIYEFLNGFCHILRDGSMFFMASDNTLRFFDSQVKNIWNVHIQSHHDLDVSLDEKRIFVLTDTLKDINGKKIEHNYVKGYSREDGKEIFSWNPTDHLDEFDALIPKDDRQEDITKTFYFHLNSVQELPPNKLESINPAFRRGNILVNCFHNSKSFIIDKDTSKIVWQHNFEMQMSSDDHTANQRIAGAAHTVKLLENGNLFYIQNKYIYQHTSTAYSAVVEMNPLTKKVVWRYLANPATDFKTELWGSAYKLSNGNALVTYSTAGSAFEVTPEGRVIWEWINPEKDEFGLPGPIYRVSHVPKELADKAIKVWKELQ